MEGFPIQTEVQGLGVQEEDPTGVTVAAVVVSFLSVMDMDIMVGGFLIAKMDTVAVVFLDKLLFA